MKSAESIGGTIIAWSRASCAVNQYSPTGPAGKDSLHNWTKWLQTKVESSLEN